MTVEETQDKLAIISTFLTVEQLQEAAETFAALQRFKRDQQALQDTRAKEQWCLEDAAIRARVIGQPVTHLAYDDDGNVTVVGLANGVVIDCIGGRHGGEQQPLDISEVDEDDLDDLNLFNPDAQDLVKE